MPQGMTEEVCRQCEFAKMLAKNARFYCTSPAPFGGTLPKGEGMNLPDKHQFILHTHNNIKNLICPIFAAQQEQGTEQSFHASRLGILGRSG